MSLRVARITMGVAALYDGVLGVGFLVAAPRLFEALNIPLINHFGYVHFAAWLLIVFAIMFAAVAVRPKANASLIFYGILLKLGYVGVTTYHWLDADLPWAWKPFIFADAAFIVAFVLAYRAIARSRQATR